MNAGHNWQEPPMRHFQHTTPHHASSGFASLPPGYNTSQALRIPPVPAKKKKFKITPLKMTLTGAGMIPLFFLGLYISVFAGLSLSWDTMSSEAETVMTSVILSLTLPLTLTFLVGSATLIVWGAVLGIINIIKKKDKIASSIVSAVVGVMMILGVLLIMAIAVLGY